MTNRHAEMMNCGDTAAGFDLGGSSFNTLLPCEPEKVNFAPRDTSQTELRAPLRRVGSMPVIKRPVLEGRFRRDAPIAQPQSIPSSPSLGHMSSAGSASSVPTMLAGLGQQLQHESLQMNEGQKNSPWRRLPLGSSLSDSHLETSRRCLVVGEAPSGRLLQGLRQTAQRRHSQQQRQDEELRYYLKLMRESGMKTVAGATNFADSKIAAKKRSSHPEGMEKAAAIAAANARDWQGNRRASTRLSLLSETLNEADLRELRAFDADSDDDEENDENGNVNGGIKKSEEAAKKAASLLNVPVPSLMEVWRGLLTTNSNGTNNNGAAPTSGATTSGICTDDQMGEHCDDELPQLESRELLESWPGNASGRCSSPVEEEQGRCDNEDQDDDSWDGYEDQDDDSWNDYYYKDHDDDSWDGSELLLGWDDHEPFSRRDSTAKDGCHMNSQRGIPEPVVTQGVEMRPFPKFKKDLGFACPA